MSNKWDEIQKEDVIKAITIYEKNPDEYSKYKAKSTFLVYGEKKYPAKAIRRIAYQVHFNELPEDINFYGGLQTKNFLEKLGFEIFYQPTPITKKGSNFIDSHYWIYSPGNNADKWDEYFEKEVMGIGFIDIGNLKQYKTKNQISRKFQDIYEDDSDHKNDVLACWEFSNVMKEKDVVFAKKGKNEVLGYGIVKSDYYYDEEIDDEYKHRRNVDWIKKGNWKSEVDFSTKTLTDITDFKEVLNNIIESFDTFPSEYIPLSGQTNGNNFRKKQFISYLNDEGYYFSKEMIENYLLSLKVKPFVILTGNSGTGKTKLAQLFAQYLQEKLDYPDSNKNYEVVAVGANWTDNRNIIGYYNTLLDKIEKTVTYDLIKKAEGDKDNPYFLILDEMNLSYVERYFADFLSAIESGEEMELPGSTEKIKLPSNLFIVGTVNVDETTYMFSPKVLDRANVLEFKTIPVLDYMSNRSVDNYDEFLNIDYLEDPTSHESFNKNNKLDIKDLKEKYSNINNVVGLWDDLKELLEKLHNILQKSGFDFGFRVTNEILSFILEASCYEGDLDSFNWERYFDAQILQKVLPKLHGSKNIIEETLDELFNFCIIEEKFEDKIDNIKFEDLNEDNTKYFLSACKLYEMLEELDKSRYVSFIN